MTTMDDIRRAGRRATSEDRAQELGRAGNRVVAKAEALREAAATLYEAAERRDFRAITSLLSKLHRYHRVMGDELAEVREAAEALAEAEDPT